MCFRGDVSTTLKFLIFFFNFVFWCTGIVFLAVGLWAYAEKHKFMTKSSDEKSSTVKVFDVLFDLTILIIILGGVIFIISFAGCIGALRENICLLKFFYFSLGTLLLIEVILATLAFVFASEIKVKITEIFPKQVFKRYRDDDDLRNFIDWAQKMFECCGISTDGYRDWSKNPYFNCTDDNPSMERCGVPYSCCRKPNEIEDTYINTQCGQNMQKKPPHEAQKYIYTYGCLQELLYIAEKNLYVIGGVALGVALIQILGIFLAKSLTIQIENNK